MFIGAPCEELFLTMEEDGNELKTTCQRCNGFLTCSVRSVKLLNVTIICAGISTLVLNPEDFVL